VPRHVAWLVTRLVESLIVDYSTSRRLVVDYFAYAARPGATARRGSSRGSSLRLSSTTLPRTGSSSTTSPTPRVRVPRHVARLVTWLVALLIVDYSMSRGSSLITSPPPRVRVPRHVARLVTWLVTRLVAPLVVDYSASCRLVVDYFPPRVRVPRHVTRIVTRLVVDYFAYAARLGCLSTSRGSSLVVDYFAYAARPGASACRAARRVARRAARRVARCAARRRPLRLAQARRRPLRLA
jgi:hypothetical protein